MRLSGYLSESKTSSGPMSWRNPLAHGSTMPSDGGLVLGAGLNCSESMPSRARCLLRVKAKRLGTEQLLSGLPSIADIQRRRRHVRSVPAADIALALRDQLAGSSKAGTSRRAPLRLSG